MNLGAFLDELEKIAASTSFAKAKGLKRVGQLLTGSREKALNKRFHHVMERGGDVGATGHEEFSAHQDRARRLAAKHFDAGKAAIHAKHHEAGKVQDARLIAGAGAGILGAAGITAVAAKKKKKKNEK